MLKYKKIVFIVIFLFLRIIASAQKPPTSLKSTTYNELKQNFLAVRNDTLKASVYANIYLLKAKKEKDTLNIAKGYHYLFYTHRNDTNSLNYLDSIIDITINKTYKDYPIGAYYLKGQKFYTRRNFQNAFVNFLEVRRLNNHQFFSEEIDVEMDYYIGLIKSRVGDFDGALDLFYKNEKYYLSQGNNSKILTSLYAIADTYRLKKQLDSSSYYNQKGIKKSLLVKNKKWYFYFLLNESATLFDKKLYQASLDSLNKCLPKIVEFNDEPNIAMAYYFMGSNLYALNNKTSAIDYFKKIDTLFINTNDIHPEIRKGYELLIKEARLKENSEEELIYVNKLLEVDKILNKNYKILSKKIIHEYDTPILLAKKEELIKKIQKKNSNYTNLIITISIVFTLLIIYFLYYANKQKTYKQKLEAILNKQKKIAQPPNKIFTPLKNQRKELSISKENITHILNKLNGFEKNGEYLNNTISVHSLAKKTETNTKYLSKVINFYKEKNFTNYLNDLRIDYAINKLTNDIQFRKFTIQAIANEVGFNNAESFSKAFYKKTGIKPSYFIRNIDKSMSEFRNLDKF